MIHSLLKLLPPERAHAIAKWAMKRRKCAPGPYFNPIGASGQQYELFGQMLRNPFGLAAGFDKNGELIDVIDDYGFGWLEVGSVTFRGGAGNPKPRLFRLPGDALLNRMGLNGDSAHVVADRLMRLEVKKSKHSHDTCRQNYGVNIAKTHSLDIVGDKAIEDIVGSYNLLKNFGIYTCINISCPNTREGKTFDDPGALNELLREIITHRVKRDVPMRPLAVKLSPTLADNIIQLDKVVTVCESFAISGYVCSNTLPFDHPKFGRGGMSGYASLRERAILLCKEVRERAPRTTIIGCGSITTGYHAMQFKQAGADLFQAYAGFVVGPHAGPTFAREINKDFERRINDEVLHAARSAHASAGK